MALWLPQLDVRTRRLMLAEFARDQASGRSLLLCLPRSASPWVLSEVLRNALVAGDEETLVAGLQGGVAAAGDAAILAADLFHAYYVRAICARALEAGDAQVVLHRAQELPGAPARVGDLLGRRVAAERLLARLRRGSALEVALGFPLGVRTGLSVRCLRPHVRALRRRPPTVAQPAVLAAAQADGLAGGAA